MHINFEYAINDKLDICVRIKNTLRESSIRSIAAGNTNNSIFYFESGKNIINK